MANPLASLVHNKAGFPARARRVLAGVARDFWKDGPENPFELFVRISRLRPAPRSAPLRSAARTPKPTDPMVWHALPGEIAEKMWGEGFVAPGGEVLLDLMLKPLALDKQANVLDLSAGLGAFLHKVTAQSEAYVTSLESDPALAIRANERLLKLGKGKVDAIMYYTPDLFEPTKTVTKVYDCVVAREVFYRVQDKHGFFAALAACTKPQAQITFTDYIVNPEDHDNDAVGAWMAYEGNVAPLGLIAMAEEWAKVGFKLRVHEDQTSLYRREALLGLQRLLKFLASGTRPDAETRQAILQRLELWTRRIKAMEQGLKLYRFYGTK
jgi:2-polyprenyl-3-methyl-5-hydroxy-6-metoxy-1,4-benzoquinol methylase